ncbi:TPM domain-containing protein [Enhygromyxa salina]|uniref:TPM domain-containing protein n=1 Tax=Enhygromyxa salina TaxID=215803 RepID=A0A2S9YYF2_9BACT|nr:TPM domain-containing protein [Enhygromyxa salina]PRQ10107.1 hypothetical protein ENSA7_01520 [Enhygromyxa salina]
MSAPRTSLLAWVLSCLVWLSVAASAARASPELPPAPSARVHDQVGVLSEPVRASLDRRLAAYEATSGHQVVVWIGRTTGDVPIEDFAVEAFERWKIGRAELDDGLAVFVLVDDRAMRVEVGYALEPMATDFEASRIIRSVMIPQIERGDWDAAIEGGVEALVDTIEGQPGALPSDDGPPQRTLADLSKLELAAIAIGVVLFLILLVTNPRLALLLLFFVGRGGGGGGGGGGGFQGGGGRSGGGGATGRW